MTSVKHSLKIALVTGFLGITCLVGRSASAQYTTPTHRKYNTGSGTVAWWITQLGLGSAGEYQISNTSNSSDALIVTTNGTGNAGKFTSNTGDAVYGIGKNGGGGHFVSLGSADGINSTSNSGNGVYGIAGAAASISSSAQFGVYGTSSSGRGVGGYSDSSIGVAGQSGSNIGVYGSTGNNSTGWAGYFDGNVEVTGTFVNPSDARYKKNIRTLPNALNTILALHGVSFDWRQNEYPDMHFGKSHQIGFIAQEVEKVAPELVSKDSMGMRSLAYTEVIPILVEAIKQQQQQIETLKAQNKQLMSLQTQFATLTARLAQLEQNQPARATQGQTIASK